MRKRWKQPAAQTIGGIMFGFEQQVLRTSPPPQELVHHARPDDPVPAADGTLMSIRMPALVDRAAPDTDADDERNTEDGPSTSDAE